MPVISRFLGIAITMLFDEHEPPHFHASYGEYEVSVFIRDARVIGRFPRRSLRHTLEWLRVHRAELLENWDLARNKRPLKPIPPLE